MTNKVKRRPWTTRNGPKHEYLAVLYGGKPMSDDAKLAELENRKRSLCDEIDRIAGEIDDLREDRSQLEDQIADLTYPLRAQIETVNQQIRDLEDERDTLEYDADAIDEEIFEAEMADLDDDETSDEEVVA
jgi:chromosome segregation ATPase